MQQEELEKKVRHIQIHSRKPVTEILAGEYRSCFKGMGIEFESVRQYQHGDDVRTINWNVTARTGKPHVKQFMEERELSLYFLIDVSGSGNFSSTGESKIEIVAQIFALLAFAAAHNNDNIGLILFSDEIEYTIKPRKGKRHVMFMIHKILEHEPKSKGTDIGAAINFLRKVRQRRCVAFLFSDFIDENYHQAMREAARQHDLICISMSDKRERELPSSGILEVVDAENGNTICIDCNDKKMRQNFELQAQQKDKDLLTFCREIDADLLTLCTSDDYLHKIISFFRSRSDRSADAK
ncbi:MAG: DUF58 domain-containing protein [Lentisphaeraceae bacterium]|nr:DUF58 domain-containing protein [Lentisphaeraceae bacterium]